MGGSRRGHREVSIHKETDGRWAAVFDLGSRKGKRERQTFYGNTRKEVAAKLAAARSARRSAPAMGDGRQTVYQFLSHWLDSVGPTLRPNTRTRYEEYIRRHVLPDIGPLRLSDLTPEHLERLYAERLTVGVSRTTIGHLHRVLHRSLSAAERLQLVLPGHGSR